VDFENFEVDERPRVKRKTEMKETKDESAEREKEETSEGRADRVRRELEESPIDQKKLAEMTAKTILREMGVLDEVEDDGGSEEFSESPRLRESPQDVTASISEDLEKMRQQLIEAHEKFQKQKREITFERLSEIERDVFDSSEAQKVGARIERMKVVLYEIPGGREEYKRIEAEYRLTFRIEHFKPYIENGEFTTHTIKEYMGLTGTTAIEARLYGRILQAKYGLYPRIIKIMREKQVRELPDWVSQRVKNKPDVEFLSCLIREYDVLLELTGTLKDSPRRHELGRAIFSRVEKIACKYFTFVDSEYEILRATEEVNLRSKIFPIEGTSLVEVVESTRGLIDEKAMSQLLEKIKMANGAFVIDSWETYALVMRCLPFTLTESKFDSYHGEMKGRLLLRKCVGDYSIDGQRVVFGKSRKEQQYSSIPSYTEFISRIERFCNRRLSSIVEHHRMIEKAGIKSLQDVLERINWFYGNDVVRNRSSFQKEVEYTAHNLVVYPLLRLGLRESLIVRYGKGKLNTQRLNAVYDKRAVQLERGLNNILKLAIQIPSEKPKEGWAWVDIERAEDGEGDKRTIRRWVQVPLKLTEYNIQEVIEILGIPKDTEERSRYFRMLESCGISREQYYEWKAEFGAIETYEQKMDAFLYMIGVMLSDGDIRMDDEGRLATSARLSSSSSYYWSKRMCDYFSYCWCSLGIPVGKGTLEFSTPPTRKDKFGSLFPRYKVETKNIGFFRWYHKEVLGLPEDGNHTDFCSRAEWILKLPERFRVAFLQGFFDGDGIVNSMAVTPNLGTASETQTDFIYKVMKSLGISCVKSTRRRGERSIRIRTESFQDAVSRPLFRYADGRLKAVQRLSEMQAVMREDSFSRRTTRYQQLICKIGKDTGRSPSRIAQILYEQIGITSDIWTIKKLLERVDRTDGVTIKAYFKFLKRIMDMGDEKIGFIRSTCEQVREETGCSSPESTMRAWIKGQIPNSVKYNIVEVELTENGWILDYGEGVTIRLGKDFVVQYPHIEKLIDSYRTGILDRMRQALEKNFEEISSHPRLQTITKKLEGQLQRLPKSDSKDDLIEVMRTVQDIGNLREPVGIRYLIPLLKHKEARIRGVTVIALSKMGGGKAVDALMETLPKEPLYTEEDIEHRRNLRRLWIRAFGIMHDPRAIDMLNSVQNDPDEVIRYEVEKALRRIREAE
jgi:hypothetical protein